LKYSVWVIGITFPYATRGLGSLAIQSRTGPRVPSVGHFSTKSDGRNTNTLVGMGLAGTGLGGPDRSGGADGDRITP
jgi:hypothetical protein